MNEERSFERFVADSVAGQSQGIPLADDFYDDMHSYATSTGQRPEWLALIKEPPMHSNSHLAVGSPTVRVLAIMLATLLLVIAIAAVGAGAQRLLAADGEIIVDATGGGDFQTIGEAVDAARDGDAVLVRAGTYVESVRIDKDITIRGDGSTDRIIVSAMTDGPTFTTSPDAGPEPYAFLLADSAATLSGLTLQGPSSSVIASGGSPTIEGNVFDSVGVAFDGLSFAAAGSAIVATNGSAAVILGNDLLSSGEIVAFGGSGPNIEGNHLVDSGPIWLEDASGDTSVVDNTVEGQIVRGISVSSPGEIRIERNRISGARDIGLRIGRNSGASGYVPLVTGNTISDSGTGVVVTDSGAPTIEDNVIDGGQTGISITGGAAQLNGNTVANVESRGIAIGGEAQTTLSGNRSCGNGVNLWVADSASPEIDDSNEICEDGSTE